MLESALLSSSWRWVYRTPPAGASLLPATKGFRSHVMIPAVLHPQVIATQTTRHACRDCRRHHEHFTWCGVGYTLNMSNVIDEFHPGSPDGRDRPFHRRRRRRGPGVRDELFNSWRFDSVVEARVIIEDRRLDYNAPTPLRPGDLTPTEFDLPWTTTHQPQAA